MPMMSLRRLGWFRTLVMAQVLVAVAVAGGLWLLRQQALDAEVGKLGALARAMALQADRTLGVGATVLRATQVELARGLIEPGVPATDALLRERVRALPGYRALSIFDAQGHRVATSRQDERSPAASIASLDFFIAAQRAGAPRLVLSSPYLAPADGRRSVSLSMGWYGPGGEFRGLLALVADPDFLDGGFARIVGAPDAGLGLFHADGRPVWSADDAADRAVSPAVARAVPPLLAGTAAPDGLRLGGGGRSEPLLAAAPLEQLPLWQLVWRDGAAVLAAWDDLAWLVGTFVAAMLAVTFGLGLRSARDQLRLEGLEERLSRSRKLEALGQLAGGVAHDFNNVLAAVMGFGELAQQAAEPGSAQARHLAQVRQAAERGRQQVARILAFSRGLPRRSQAFALQPLVEEVLAHLVASTPAGVQVRSELRGEGLVVRGDATATYEALMNLCTNAWQAMPQGGELQVRLQARALRRPRPMYDTSLPPGRYAELQVSDSGEGMSAQVLSRLFEPFFTTKSGHGGTGIGLAIVHGVVSGLGGAIDVRSQPGQGTSFTLLLPLSDERPDPLPGAPLALPRGEDQTILVVDDDPALVELAEELLAELGYQAVGTTSSPQALQALQADPQGFDLLLSDEVMPELSGTALARAARALRPSLPVLLVSGYGGEDIEARAAEAGVREVLAKPLTREALAQAVHRALRGT